MRIELTQQEANLVMQALGEMPAKFSYLLLQNLSNQIAAHNQMAQAAQVAPPAPPDIGGPADD